MRLKIQTGLASLACLLALASAALPARAQHLSFKIPPVRTSVDIQNQPIAIVASGTISQIPAPQGQNVFKLELLGDFSDLQQNITNILRAQLDKADRCGERIAIQHATLTPLAPASSVVAQLHFEQWKCVKLLGKERPEKLVGGNGVVQVKLVPVVDQRTTLRLEPEVGRIDADGPVGELLRSGQFGARLREKIARTLLSAMQKGTNFKATLPPAVQDYASLDRARFADGGGGVLDVILDGQIHISDQQVKELTNEIKERVSRPATQ
jgi:hypothetical protein